MNRKTAENLAPHLDADAAARDLDLIDQLDAMVRNAACGDDRAIVAIAVGFGPMLVEEARQELELVGLPEADAPDALQTFCLALVEKRLRVPAVRGAALPWMKRIVRVIARDGLRDLGPDAA